VGTKPLTEEDVRKLLQRRIEQAGSQFKFCIETAIHPSTLNKVLHHTNPPTPAILNALGLKKVVTFEPK